MSDLLARLIQAGTPADLVAEVARELARAEVAQEAIQARREKDAERQRRRRDKRDGNVTSRDNTDVTVNTLDKKGPQTPKKINPKSPPIVPPKPEGVSDNVWRDFLAHRKRKKADLTETALEAICSEAAKAGWRLEAALTECVARNWQGFKAEWVAQATGPPGSCDPLVTKILARQAAGH